MVATRASTESACPFVFHWCVCAEKEELVNLVLIHVDNPSSFSADSQPSQAYTMGTDHSDDGRSNPFDHIRSTCQNLFTTFTDRISTGNNAQHTRTLAPLCSNLNTQSDFADFNFDFKSNASDVERPSNVCENQPRHSDNFRHINPLGSNGAANNPANNGNRNHQRPTTMTSSLHRPSEAGSPDLDDFVVTSPVIGTGTRSSSDSSSTSSPSCNQSSSRSMAHDSQNATTSNGSGSKGCQPGSSAVKYVHFGVFCHNQFPPPPLLAALTIARTLTPTDPRHGKSRPAPR